MTPSSNLRRLTPPPLGGGGLPPLFLPQAPHHPNSPWSSVATSNLLPRPADSSCSAGAPPMMSPPSPPSSTSRRPPPPEPTIWFWGLMPPAPASFGGSPWLMATPPGVVPPTARAPSTSTPPRRRCRLCCVSGNCAPYSCLYQSIFSPARPGPPTDLTGWAWAQILQPEEKNLDLSPV
jgi:hypothetical protein